jgi:LPXTG-motif cell wall-anchored protein
VLSQYQEVQVKVRKLVVLSLVAALMALALVPAAFAQGGTAKVRVIHASPDAPAVDVYVNGNLTLSNVPFFTASDYLDLPAGTYQVQVTPTGQPASAAVIDASATIEAGKAYTIAATGLVANIQPTIIEDDLTAPASGNAHVRVYHFSPDAPAVDVQLADGTKLIEGIAFPDASDYLPVPAGSYDIQVVPAGGSDVVIDLAGTALEAGKIYSVFATGEVANITPEVAVFTPAAAAPAPGPSTLPATGAGDSAPMGAIALVAALLIGAALVLRRRAAL